MAKVKIQAVRSKDTIVLVLDGESINIQKKSHPEVFEEIDQMMKNDDLSGLERQFEQIKKRIEKFTKGVFTASPTKGVTLRGDSVVIPEAIVKKLQELEEAGEDFLPLLRFWRKLKSNPSKNSREQLYSFMMANKMNITEQGDIVFEKGVMKKRGGSPDELVDGHTGQVDHSIGMVVEMPRDQVNDDPNQVCSRGLHCAPPEYVRRWYGNNVIIECIVNPRDVVSVPKDYNQQKVRVCRLQVMGYASKTPRDQQVVKLDDFLKDMPEHYSKTKTMPVRGGRTKGTKTISPTHSLKGSGKNLTVEVTDAQKEIEGKTAKEIIAYVKSKTGDSIAINLKNKNGIIKKAIEILTKYNEKHAKQMETEVKEQLGTGADTSAIEEMTAKEIIAHVNGKYGVDLSHIGLKNKQKIKKEAIAIIEAHHAADMAKATEDVTGEFNPKDSEKGLVDAPEEESKETLEPGSEPVSLKTIYLSNMSKDQIVKEVRDRFNEKIGGLLVSEKKVRERARKIYLKAGYVIK